MPLGVSERKRRQALAASRYVDNPDKAARVALNIRWFPRELKKELIDCCTRKQMLLQDLVVEIIDQYLHPPIRSKEHQQDMVPDLKSGPPANQNPTGHWKFSDKVDADLT
jgi:hypothetical protein